MLQTRNRRLAVLLGAVALTASVIGGAIVTTGAYYTDSKGGQVGGTNGDIKITVSGAGGTGTNGINFDWTGLLPGVTKTASITVYNTTNGPEAVWLVFDNSNSMWSGVNTLGQYGKFTIGSLIYDNLNNSNHNTLGPTPGQAGAPTGDYMTGYCSTVPRVPINYLPRAVKVANLPAYGSQTFDVTFQYNPCLTSGQGAMFGPLMFSVAAFQDGVDPTSPFNGANAITPFPLAGEYNLQYIQP